MARNIIYILPGRGNTLRDIGNIVHSFGYDVCGREVIPPFSTLSFPAQLEIIQKDLTSHFWYIDAKLIGHSYGGYLLLHALSELEFYPGKILLLSPVLGQAVHKKQLYISRPPRADKLLTLAETNKFPISQYLEVHTGEVDNGCDPDLARKIEELVSEVKVKIVPNQGHELPTAYVKEVISNFLIN